MASLLLAGRSAGASIPELLYAPGVVANGREALLVGVGLMQGEAPTKVFLDGRRMPILAGSPLSLVAAVPTELETGSGRELWVEVGGFSSNVFETDVAAIRLVPSCDEEPGAVACPNRIAVAGTLLPCGLRVQNRARGRVSLRSADGSPIGAEGFFLTQGGADNHVELGVLSSLDRGDNAMEVDILPELCDFVAGESPGDGQVVARRSCRALLVALRKEQLVLESEMEATSRRSGEAKRDAQLGLTGEARDPALRLLSLRHSRISRMLDGQRALFKALGGTDEEYRSALADAGGTALRSLDQADGPQMRSSSPEESRPESQAPSSPERNASRGRLHRLVAPAIKLLPPAE